MKTQTDWQIVRPVHTHPPLCQPISTCFTSLTELHVILYYPLSIDKKKVGRGWGGRKKTEGKKTMQ